MRKIKLHLIILIIFLIPIIPAYASQEPIKLSGLGITFIKDKSNKVVISGILKGSPADGILESGDIILKIDNVSLNNLLTDGIYGRFEKPAGSQIKLLILRNNIRKEIVINCFDYPITPDIIPSSNKPTLRILGPQGGSQLICEFKDKKDLKISDEYFLFENNRLLGSVIVQQFCGNKAIVKLSLLKDSSYKTSGLWKYSLNYYRYYPAESSGGSSSTAFTLPENENDMIAVVYNDLLGNSYISGPETHHYIEKAYILAKQANNIESFMSLKMALKKSLDGIDQVCDFREQCIKTGLGASEADVMLSKDYLLLIELTFLMGLQAKLTGDSANAFEYLSRITNDYKIEKIIISTERSKYNTIKSAAYRLLRGVKSGL